MGAASAATMAAASNIISSKLNTLVASNTTSQTSTTSSSSSSQYSATAAAAAYLKYAELAGLGGPGAAGGSTRLELFHLTSGSGSSLLFSFLESSSSYE